MQNFCGNKMILQHDDFDAEQIISDGNKFLTGNGRLGYRGTLDEMTRQHCVGLNIAGLYDGVKGKWRETVNAFNPFYLELRVDGKQLAAWDSEAAEHACTLDISCGVFSRRTVFRTQSGELTFCSTRFCSMADVNCLAARATLVAERDMDVEIVAGVDPDVWELNGPHFVDVSSGNKNRSVWVKGKLQESGTPLTVMCEFSQNPDNFVGSYAHFCVKLKAGQKFVLDRCAQVLVGNAAAKTFGFDEMFEQNAQVWAELWKTSDVLLQGDGVDDAQFALRYSVYQMLILRPQEGCSIAARGLSAQTYKGAVFWDTEMFLLPFFLKTDPISAKRLVQYRIRTLDGARQKAKSYGYDGAFYAWESQNGQEACTDFNVTDVFTHRPVRTYFRDKQIHISADVALGLLRYFDQTADVDILLDGGLEMLLEVGKFYYCRSYFNHVADRFELLDVMGPDEYHERVNNNAYTNYMAYHVVQRTSELCAMLKKSHPRKLEKILGVFEDGLAEKLARWAEKLYLPQCNQAGVMEQFDGYFELEDVSVEQVRSRLVHPREYWGGTTGVATPTRVIKQADVIMLAVTLPQYFSARQLEANYKFYLPYTEHGSSLSASAYAIAASRLGLGDEAWQGFLQTATIDLVGGGKQWAGDVYIGGTHPAANGGAWMVAQQFANGGRPSFLHGVKSNFWEKQN